MKQIPSGQQLKQAVAKSSEHHGENHWPTRAGVASRLLIKTAVNLFAAKEHLLPAAFADDTTILTSQSLANLLRGDNKPTGSACLHPPTAEHHLPEGQPPVIRRHLVVQQQFVTSCLQAGNGQLDQQGILEDTAGEPKTPVG
jgi:hypothetical protein